MSTIVTVWDFNGGNYAMRIAEDFPLQEDMMRLVDGTYYYAIATCHTRDAESQLRISNAIKHMRCNMGNSKLVQQVLIGNSEEHVIFVNPRIELFEAYGDLFMELRTGTVRRSAEGNRRRAMSIGH
jgi:hypothetical protein